MSRARSLAITGMVLLGIGLAGWAIPVAQAATSSPALATGWWSRQPLAQPVAEGGFQVDWAAEQEQSMAAVRLDVSAATSATAYLVLKEAGATAQDQAAIVVCATPSQWVAANPGAYADRPTADCAASPSVQLGRDAGALEWVGDVSALVGSGSAGVLSVVVRPVGKPLADGVTATAPFSVQFSAAELRIEDATAGPTGSTTTETTFVSTFDESATPSYSDPGISYPAIGGSFDTPALAPVETPALTPDTAGPSPDEVVALGPVDVTSSSSRPWGRLVVLTPLSAGLGALAAAGRRWLLDGAAGSQALA